MNEIVPAAGLTADWLARAYIDELAKAENVKSRPMLGASASDALAALLNDLEGPEVDDGPHLRVDLVMAAVLTAKAVAGEEGLARRLRREAPIVIIETHTADMVPLVETIVTDCAAAGNKGKYVIARDGNEKSHTPERGNSDVIASLNRRKLTMGIASDVRRYLPSSLLRTAEYQLTMPPIDEWSVRLVIEAVTGTAFTDPIDPELIRTADIQDLSLAIRAGLTPIDCLARLAGILQDKTSYLGEGSELKELHGYGEAMGWALDLVDDLKEFKAGRLGWDLVDNVGLLLAGPPGTGKTSFARAVAKTAGVPLVASSVAEWNAATYLSGTLQAIRDVFGKARRAAPCVLLIDEIDGISDRSKISGEYTEYWLQIVNCLLECLSGVVDNTGVCVIATTNFPDRIDAALRRAGRLDREIVLAKPGSSDLALIFRHYLGTDLLVEADLLPAALAANGRTGADVEAYVRRAKAKARRANRDLEIGDLMDQIREGRPPMAAELRRRVAIHECGHVLVARQLQLGQVVGATINDSGGEAEFANAIDRSLTMERMVDTITVLLAGRAAERLVLGNVAVGSALDDDSDLSRATAFAEVIETTGGGAGTVYLRGDRGGNLIRVPGLLKAVSKRLEEAEQRAVDILATQRVLLDTMSERLDAAGYLSAIEIDQIALLDGSHEAAE